MNYLDYFFIKSVAIILNIKLITFFISSPSLRHYTVPKTEISYHVEIPETGRTPISY